MEVHWQAMLGEDDGKLLPCMAEYNVLWNHV